MRNFPWLEAALFVALVVALIVKPQNKTAAAPPAPMQALSPFAAVPAR
jgi:hypothetical protein